MSLNLSHKKYYYSAKYNITEEKIINLKKAIISFSQLSAIPHNTFIYTGEEEIPFNDTHPVYQAILRNEFADAIKKSFKEKKQL